MKRSLELFVFQSNGSVQVIFATMFCTIHVHLHSKYMAEMKTYSPSWEITKNIIRYGTVNTLLCFFWCFIVYNLIGHLFNPEFKESPLSDIDVFMTICFSPLVENLILAKSINNLQKTQLTNQSIIFICGLIWALLHAIILPFWSVFAFVNFCLMSKLYIKFSLYSKTTGFMAILYMHVLLNSLSVLFQG